MVRSRAKRLLLGLGLDGQDGHVRQTKGENFRLVGGSAETHERMQETAIKINEKLAERGQRLDSVSAVELGQIAREVGLLDAKS